jgi:phytoene/squalene synthetase
LLPVDARVAVRSAAALFSAVTDTVARTPVEELYRRRVRVSDMRKGTIVARALARTWRERA